MQFEPIAIVGRGCVLPDALTPEQFWINVLERRLSISATPAERWLLSHRSPVSELSELVMPVGGYVHGFESVFNPSDFAIPAEHILGLDPLFHWVLYGARQALREAGQEEPTGHAGLTLGNLSFPSVGMSRFAEEVWLGAESSALREALVTSEPGQSPDPRNRFNSGLPAHIAARALGLAGGGFALDAACASALYAMKLACDRLHDRSADLMVAGAINRADDLFIHKGFSALSALSPSGQSRPFHRDADGLVPAEGAAFVALMRMSDALESGNRIFGVIRGIGLSNDGKGHGLLVPSVEGQVRAMRSAYQAAGVAPDSVSLLECHATGTPVGDEVEVLSTAEVFSSARDLPIGSVKSNLGHLITAAGTAGVLKVLGAMEHGIRPPMLSGDPSITALAGTPLRLLTAAEDWQGPRRAAVSAFGFGGNNAHLIVDQWQESNEPIALPPTRPVTPHDHIAIIAIGARVADCLDTKAFRDALLSGTRHLSPRADISLELDGLRFPPKDIEQTLGQQTLILDAAREAVAGIQLPRERTMVLAGMGCDAEIARYSVRWRVSSTFDHDNDLDGIVRKLTSAGVLGTMPNIVANRLNAQLDLAGPSFSVSAEEASGVVALELAARALRANEVDAAVVGAVDLSCEPVHAAALAALERDDKPGDAAVVMVLKRLSDVQRDGDQVIALIDEDVEGPADILFGDVKEIAGKTSTDQFDPTELFGSAHAAKGLVAVASAAIALHCKAIPRTGSHADPALGKSRAEVVVSALGAETTRVRLRGVEHSSMGWVSEEPPHAHIYSGNDRADVLSALSAEQEADTGPARLVIMATDDAELRNKAEAARQWLTNGGRQPDGVAFRTAPIPGEIAFVFTNGSASYPGMGKELMLAFPEVLEKLVIRCGAVDDLVGWAYTYQHTLRSRRALEQIWGASLVSQLHTEIARNILGIQANAVLSYSSGESTSLVAMEVWRDVPTLIKDTIESGFFTQSLVGDFTAVQQYWQREGLISNDTRVKWLSCTVGISAAQAESAVQAEPTVYLMAINSPDSCVIGGEEIAVRRVIDKLGPVNAFAIDYEIAAHAPVVDEVRDQWWKLYFRPTDPAPGVRFYSAATTESYIPTPEAVADAMTAQAIGTIDFAKVVDRAWNDGVRVFIELGPRALCTGWIRSTLGTRDHLAIAMDDARGWGVRQLIKLSSELLAAGIPFTVNRLLDRLADSYDPSMSSGRRLALPAHLPKVSLPMLSPAESEIPNEEMSRAPWLPLGDEPTSAPGLSVKPVPALSSSETALSILGDYRVAIAKAHQDFLARQTDIHQRFLAMRQRFDALLLSTIVTNPPLPVPQSQEDVTSSVVTFDREQLEFLASGNISELFGPQFAEQDAFLRQTRMPQPPMLLTDRVTAIDAVPTSLLTLGSAAVGTIWTETDVRQDSWYLDSHGRMPTGIMIEAGQADLLLISWLGVDLLNRGERVYRLLGCDLTFHGSPASLGETLHYEIHIDGHGTVPSPGEANGSSGDVRLFFFHYDCTVGGQPRMSVRNGQAGFFTENELAHAGGVLWDPQTELPEPASRLDPPLMRTSANSFTAEQVQAFAEGRTADCFGPEWNPTRAHVHSPRIGVERMLLLDEVTEFDPSGGPWHRGYLRAETSVSPADWFFQSHFKNDPCMPGTLMFEGCLQAMSFYLAAMGFTLDRDGWRFEPIPEQTCRVRCRGQVTPSSRHISYEVFVVEVSGGPEPELIADVLCTVDGVKAMHANRIGVRLVPDWPLEYWSQLAEHADQTTGDLVPLSDLGGLLGYQEPKPVAEVNGFRFDYRSLLACAWGRPSNGFGPGYARFDSFRRVARLPGPPYHFMSRIVAVTGPQFGMQTPSAVTVEYDIPDSAWYFDQSGHSHLPFCILMEVVLQPCGWLAAYVGSSLTTDEDLLSRNLDGQGTVFAEIGPDTKVLRTQVELTTISRSANTLIESFQVTCFADDVKVFELSTVFGCFTAEALVDQVGLPTSAQERAALTASGSQVVDLTTQPDRYYTSTLRLPGPMLLMLDRVTGYWPNGGKAGLGRLLGEKDVDPGEWFFRAHFFQDPVQPGSLGIEAMCQLLQFYMIETDMGAGLVRPRFEPVMTGRNVKWKYRGQITPKNQTIRIELDIVQVGRDESGPFAVAEAWLWADDTRVYHTSELSMRIVESDSDEEVLDTKVDTWLSDHRPTWTTPAVPMMSVLDRMAGAVMRQTGKQVVALKNIQMRRWVLVPDQLRLRSKVDHIADDAYQVSLLAWRESTTPALSRFEQVASGTVHIGGSMKRPEPFAPLVDAVPGENPYDKGTLFHGPRFHYLTSISIASEGSSTVLDASAGSVPYGTLGQGLLDAAVHGIPHDQLWMWSARIDKGTVAFPHRVKSLELFEKLPAEGKVLAEVRFIGFDNDNSSYPVFDIQLIAEERVIAAMRLVEILLPKGRIGSADTDKRGAFLRDRQHVSGLGLSAVEKGVTRLSVKDVELFDWLPGTTASIYGLNPGKQSTDQLTEIAIKDHVGQLCAVHPSAITVADDMASAWPSRRPEDVHHVRVEHHQDEVVVMDSVVFGSREC